MLIDEIRSQINAFEEKITKIKEEATKKEVLTKNIIEAEYNPKINELQSIFKKKLKNIEQIKDKVGQLVSEKKKEKIALKELSKEVDSLLRSKSNALRVKIKELNLEKMNRIKAINKEIKVLQKKLNTLEAKIFTKKWNKWASYMKEPQKSN